MPDIYEDDLLPVHATRYDDADGDSNWCRDDDHPYPQADFDAHPYQITCKACLMAMSDFGAAATDRLLDLVAAKMPVVWSPDA